MTDTEHRDLAVVLHAAQGMVILSGYACDLYDVELYSDWHRVTRATHADGARKRAEVLWLSPATVERLNQLHIPFEA
jgi:DNA adenine methylase